MYALKPNFDGVRARLPCGEMRAVVVTPRSPPLRSCRIFLSEKRGPAPWWIDGMVDRLIDWLI